MFAQCFLSDVAVWNLIPGWLYLVLFVLLLAVVIVLEVHSRYILSFQEKQIHSLHSQNKEQKKSLKREHDLRLKTEAELKSRRVLQSNISHDILTSLNAVSGFTQVLQSSDDEHDEQSRKEYLDNIMSTTNQLIDIVGRYMEMSHFDNLQKVRLVDRISLNFFGQQVVQHYRHLVKGNVEVRYISYFPDNFIFRSNEECLRKIIGHLMDNAVKFTFEGAIYLTVMETEKKDGLLFAVSDTGPGIPQEKRPLLLNDHFDTSEDVKPVGMGLNICRRICQLLGGNIMIDPNYNKGTRIIFNIKIKTKNK